MKEKLACENDSGPAEGVCRITLALSPASVLAKKKSMAKEQQDAEQLDDNNNNPTTTQTSSEVHRKIRKSLRILRPPHLATVQDLNDDDMMQPGKRRRNAFRPRSVTQQLIDPTCIVAGVRCQHQLLVDAHECGKVYVNGSLVVDCSDDSGSDALPAHTLFGVDFTLPSRGSQSEILPNKLTLEREYGALLVDALIFAGQSDADVAGKLLGRLITGNTERPTEPEDTSSNTGSRYHDSLPRTEKCLSIKFDNISNPCLESIVLSSSVHDPVGIGAKAIGTKFRMQYGKEAFPCEAGSSDEFRLHRLLGAQKTAKIVPRRARDVLKRGAYLGIDQMASFLWTQGLGSSWDGNHSDAMRAAEAQEGAIKLLKKGGFQDVKPDNIRFVARKKLEPVIDDDDDDQTSQIDTPSSVSKLRCWYDASSGNYYVSDAILFVEEDDKPSDGEIKDSKSGADESDNAKPQDKDSSEKKVAGNSSSPRPASAKDAAYLLAFYIAKEHPNPSSQVINMLNG